MRVFTNVDGLRAAMDNAIGEGKIVGLVPTMGALHAGHLSLVDLARKHCDVVVVSIFVNPTQFNESADFDRYPRTPEADLSLLRSSGCEVVFMPDYSEVYPEPDNTVYDFGNLDRVFEGQHRPGHFKGVAMVVRRLFEIVRPHKAFFGLKDYQQVLVIRSLVMQFNLPVEIVGAPTMREPDGLAMSSRNQLLNDTERKEAAFLSKVLFDLRDRLKTSGVDGALKIARQSLLERGTFQLEYLDIADAEDLSPAQTDNQAQKLVAVIAARLGKVRLIDNLNLN